MSNCVNAQDGKIYNTIKHTTAFATQAQNQDYMEAVNKVLVGTSSIDLDEAVEFDKKDKIGIKNFMEGAKLSMVRCEMASNMQNISSDAILIACEPFYRYVARSNYGQNNLILRRYGIGKKIMLALAVGAAGAYAANNSPNSGGLVAIAAAGTSAAILSIPNDWNLIEPKLKEVLDRSSLAWQVAKINEIASK